MLSADVTLAETTRYPIPVMLAPEAEAPPLPLEEWLLALARADSGKGFRLDFKSTRVVEPAFRVLARHSDSFARHPVSQVDALTLSLSHS